MTDQRVEPMPNEQAIRLYLLNRMTEPEREAFEGKYFDDDALFERVQSVEEDLIEDYARNQLVGEKRDWFEAHYFATEARRERVVSAQDLLTVSLEFVEQQARQISAASEAEVIRQEKLPWWKSLSSLFSGNLYPTLATAAAVLFLVLGALLLWQNLRLQNQITEDQVRRAELVRREQELEQQLLNQRADQANVQAELAVVKQQLAQLGGKPTDPLANLVARLTFAPGSKGVGPGRTNKLTLSAAHANVEIVVRINTDEYQSFRVAIAPASGGAAILNRTGLKARGLAVAFTLPADKLTARAYVLQFSGVRPTGEIDELDTYTFQVERP